VKISKDLKKYKWLALKTHSVYCLNSIKKINGKNYEYKTYTLIIIPVTLNNINKKIVKKGISA